MGDKRRGPAGAIGGSPGGRLGPVEVGPVAHGGHCVARHDGRVIFVRHALPGERVMVELTDTSHDRFWRGDAVEVLAAAADRVRPPCPIAGPGRCGGCDFQHVSPPAQRRLKADVVAEQLHRLAGLDWSGTVEPIPVGGRDSSLGWRTRMRYRVDESGRAALRAHRSHRLVPLPEPGCLIAAPETPRVVGRTWPAGADLLAVAAADGPALLAGGRPLIGSAVVRERAAGRDWSVAADGFWQVHPGAADVLVEAVRAGLQPRTGERALDLYCGAGLFAGALADAGCRVWAVEADRTAAGHARANLADVGERVQVVAGRVDRLLPGLPEPVDLVVLDPPRTGAGQVVMAEIVRRRPRAVAYVACDPAALARDLATALGLGYAPVGIRAFDAFPMTHHVECVAVLQPAPGRHH